MTLPQANKRIPELRDILPRWEEVSDLYLARCFRNPDKIQEAGITENMIAPARLRLARVILSHGGGDMTVALAEAGLAVEAVNLPDPGPMTTRALAQEVRHIYKDFQRAQALEARNPGAIQTAFALPDASDDQEEEIGVTPWPTPGNKMFHGFAGRFVQEVTRDSEADPVAVLATFLARVGIEFGPKPRFYVGADQQRTKFNAVLVGASSKARKGTSAGPVRELFAGLEQPAQTTPGPLSSGEGIVYAIRDEVREWKTSAKQPEGYEVVADPGVPDKRLFVLSGEFAGALKAMKREGNTLSVVIREGFDNGRIAPLTKTSRTSATGHHIGIVAHITAMELERELSAVEIFNGLGNRFLWVCVRRQQFVAFPKRLDPIMMEGLRTELQGIVAFAQGIEQVTLSPEAAQSWGGIYRHLSRDRGGVVGSIMGRAEVMTLRVAMVYALLDQSTQIRMEHLEAALSVIEYAEQSARYIFGGIEVDPTKQKIITALEGRPDGMTGTEIIRSVFQNHLSGQRLRSVLSELEAERRIKMTTRKGKGRPAQIFSLVRELSEVSEESPCNEVEGGLSSHTSLNSQPMQKKESTVELF